MCSRDGSPVNTFKTGLSTTLKGVCGFRSDNFLVWRPFLDVREGLRYSTKESNEGQFYIKKKGDEDPDPQSSRLLLVRQKKRDGSCYQSIVLRPRLGPYK